MSPELKESLLDWAEVADAHRVVPKIIMAGYGYIIWYSSFWFMYHPAPTEEHKWFINVVWAVALGITKWYFETGRDWTGVKK